MYDSTVRARGDVLFSYTLGACRLGNTHHCVRQLQAGSSVSLPVRAAFLRPGMYDLNRFRFVVNMPANASQLVPGVSAKLKTTGNMVRLL